MTRVRASSFEGIAHGDGDYDAVVFKRVLRQINRELNRAYDVATGANSIGDDSMDHSETGRGSLLGMPIVNQTIGVLTGDPVKSFP